jgi:hypothetical protein
MLVARKRKMRFMKFSLNKGQSLLTNRQQDTAA